MFTHFEMELCLKNVPITPITNNPQHAVTLDKFTCDSTVTCNSCGAH